MLYLGGHRPIPPGVLVPTPGIPFMAQPPQGKEGGSTNGEGFSCSPYRTVDLSELICHRIRGLTPFPNFEEHAKIPAVMGEVQVRIPPRLRVPVGDSLYGLVPSPQGQAGARHPPGAAEDPRRGEEGGCGHYRAAWERLWLRGTPFATQPTPQIQILVN